MTKQNYNKTADAITLIAIERQRQINTEGWTAEHDDEHDNHEMAIAAACYAAPGAPQGFSVGNRPRNKLLPFWPWAQSWWKPTPDNRIRELTKAGALIVAEIERLQRLEERK